MSAKIIRFPGTPRTPEETLEEAKALGIETVIVIGLRPNKPLWVSTSTSDMQEVMFMLDWAKTDMMAHVVEYGRQLGEGDA